MATVHIAPMGHEYEVREAPGKPPVRQAVGKVRDGFGSTFCGLSVPAKAVRVGLPFDHPDACPKCVEEHPKRLTDFAQPVMW